LINHKDRRDHRDWELDKIPTRRVIAFITLKCLLTLCSLRSLWLNCWCRSFYRVNRSSDKEAENVSLNPSKRWQSAWRLPAAGRIMTKIAILPEPTETGVAYRAIAGAKQSIGKTAGEALDALAGTLPTDESGTLVIVQHFRPDCFFTAQQQQRLEELMGRWRIARDRGTSLSTGEQSELDALIEAEVRAASQRAAAMLREVEG